MRWKTNALSLVVLAMLIASPGFLSAQNKKYTLSGQVRDSVTALPVKNPSVIVAGSNYKDEGDTSGNYKIDELPPGTNNLVVFAEGYDTAVIKFEIRRNMRLNVRLLPQPKADTVPPKTTRDTAIKDSVKKGPAITQKQPKKEKEKKPKKTGLTDRDKENLKVLIEDAIFAKSMYFSRIKEKKGKVYIDGSFTIDTGFIYDFESVFKRKEDGFELCEFKFKLKGKAGL